MAIMHNNNSRSQNNKSKVMKVALLAWLQEGRQLFNFHGNNDEILAMKNAFLSTQALHEEVNSDNSSVESIVSAVKVMRENTREFERITGIKWPL